MPRMSDNETPSLLFFISAAPPSQTPSGDYKGIPTGDVRLCVLTVDNSLHRVDALGNAVKISMDIDPTVGGTAPGVANKYLRISLDGGATWYRLALSPDE